MLSLRCNAPTAGHIGVALQRRLWVLGGATASGQLLNDVHSIDVSSSQLAALPSRRDGDQPAACHHVTPAESRLSLVETFSYALPKPKRLRSPPPAISLQRVFAPPPKTIGRTFQPLRCYRHGALLATSFETVASVASVPFAALSPDWGATSTPNFHRPLEGRSGAFSAPLSSAPSSAPSHWAFVALPLDASPLEVPSRLTTEASAPTAAQDSNDPHACSLVPTSVPAPVLARWGATSQSQGRARIFIQATRGY